MKKGLRITLRIVGLVLVLVLGIGLAIQLPVVQSYMGRRVVAALDGKIHGKISFGKISVLPFKAIVAEDLLLIDEKPSREDLDTVIHVGSLSAKFSIRGLFDGKGIHLSDLRLENGVFCLVNEPRDSSGANSNIKRLFSSGKKPGEPAKPLTGNIFDASDVKITGLRYRMLNFDKPVEVPERTINWTDLDVRDINLMAEDVRLRGTVVIGKVKSLSFKEKSGFMAHSLSGEVRNGNGETYIRDLRILTDSSDIRAKEFSMLFPCMACFSNFIEEVRLKADFDHALVDFEDIAYFSTALRPMNFRSVIDGSFDGFVSDFTVRNLKFSMADGRSRMSAMLDGNLRGLPDAVNMVVDASLKDADFTLGELGDFIRGFAPASKIDLGKLAAGSRFRMNVRARGPMNGLGIKGHMAMSGATGGAADVDLMLKNAMLPQKPMEIGGSVSTDGLDLGRVLGNGSFGQITMNTVADVVLSPGVPRMKIDTLNVGSLNFNGYDYKGISLKGEYTGEVLDAAIVSKDPNLDMNLEMNYRPGVSADHYGFISGKVASADLHALNFSKSAKSVIGFGISGSMLKDAGGQMRADMDVTEVSLEGEDGVRDIGDIDISMFMSDEDNSLSINSKFLQGNFSGNRFLGDFVKDVSDASIRRELPNFFGEMIGTGTGNRYNVNLTFLDSGDLLSFLMPGSYIEKGTSVTADLYENGLLEANVRSGRIALKDKYLKDVSVILSNASESLSGNVLVSELSAGAINSYNNQLKVYAADNHIGVGVSYDNESTLTNKGELYFTGEVGRGPDGKPWILGQTLPSNVYFNSNPWSIGEAHFAAGAGEVLVDSLVIGGISQSILLDGGFSSARKDTLSLALENFDLAIADAFMPSGLNLRGLASGYAQVVSDPEKERSILLDIGIDSVSVASTKLGKVNIGSRWNEETSSFDLALRNMIDSTYTIMARASYKPETRDIKGNVYFRSFDIGFAEPMLESVFSEVSGKISGGVRISGRTDSPDLSSSDLYLNDAVLRLDFTNVAYLAGGPLRIANDGVHFEGISLKDRFDGTGTLNGGITWNRLKDMGLDIRADISRLEALNIHENTAGGFYGNVFATGNVTLTGPFNALALNVDASTVKSGSLHIPLSSAASVASSNLLTFVSFDDIGVTVDPYEEMLGKLNDAMALKAGNDMRIKLKVNVNENTSAVVELDKASGNVITARGNGPIEIDVRPSRDVLDFGGRYNITSGNFHLDALGIATRDFRLVDGSYIMFNGDIMDSQLEIGAVYRTKAPIGTLVADNTSTARRNVDCGIKISDSAKNPRISFSIDIPDLDPSTQGLVESALSTQDNIQKQFLSLLISGSFLPDEQSGIVNNANMLNTTISEIMSGQLNNILQKLDISLDLGLDFQTGAGGQSLYDLAVSTELFNNRVIVNGTFGNRLYNTSSSQSEIFGDLDIEIKLDKAGALRLSLFSHSADQYTSYLDDSQRNGVGLSYQKDFKSLGDFFKRIFMKKKDDEDRGDDAVRKISIEKE